MRSRALSIVAILAGLLTFGCWTMQEVVPADDGGSDTDSDGDTDTDGDSDSDTDSDVDTVYWSTIRVTHTSIAPGNYGSETLSLTAFVYDQDIPVEDMVGYSSTHDTEGGGFCHIFYFSEYGEFPELPTQYDIGPIWAGPNDASDYLQIQYEDDAYTVDYRSDTSAENPLPDWFHDNADFYVRGDGTTGVSDLEQLAYLPGPSSFTSPVPDENTILTNDAGDYVVSWEQVDGMEVRVRMSFNMDWDWADFICYPATGSSQVVIPQGWISEYTWGGGSDMLLEVVDTHQLQAGEASVEVEAVSAYRQTGDFGY